MLDTRELIETPEGAQLPLEIAGCLVRACAYGIDWCIRGLVLIVFAIIVGRTGRFGSGLILLLYFFMEWFYPVVFEVWRQGATPGKKFMRLAVVNDDGTPIGFSASLLRNLLMAADFLPFFYATGILCSVCHPQFKRLGDMAAGTLVIHRPRPGKPPVLNEELGVLAVPVGFSTREQRALVMFAERQSVIAPARQLEIAQQLAPLLPGDNSVEAILQMANSIAGASAHALDGNPRP